MRTKQRIATNKEIVMSFEVVPFEKEYIKQQLDNHLENYFREEWKEKLIAFYWEDNYKAKIVNMINIISNDPLRYCEFVKSEKDIKEWKEIVRLQLKKNEVEKLLKSIYSEYFSKIKEDFEYQIKILMNSKDMEALNGYYWKDNVEYRLRKFINEIISNPQKYWRLDSLSYSLVDEEWKIIKEKEITELWEKYFDEDAVKNASIYIGILWWLVATLWLWGAIILVGLKKS